MKWGFPVSGQGMICQILGILSESRKLYVEVGFPGVGAETGELAALVPVVEKAIKEANPGMRIK
jgi:hypothetical protein